MVCNEASKRLRSYSYVCKWIPEKAHQLEEEVEYLKLKVQRAQEDFQVVVCNAFHIIFGRRLAISFYDSLFWKFVHYFLSPWMVPYLQESKASQSRREVVVLTQERDAAAREALKAKETAVSQAKEIEHLRGTQ